jgi:hypothetical protein
VKQNQRINTSTIGYKYAVPVTRKITFIRYLLFFIRPPFKYPAVYPDHGLPVGNYVIMFITSGTNGKPTESIEIRCITTRTEWPLGVAFFLIFFACCVFPFFFGSPFPSPSLRLFLDICFSGGPSKILFTQGVMTQWYSPCLGPWDLKKRFWVQTSNPLPPPPACFAPPKTPDLVLHSQFFPTPAPTQAPRTPALPSALDLAFSTPNFSHLRPHPCIINPIFEVKALLALLLVSWGANGPSGQVCCCDFKIKKGNNLFVLCFEFIFSGSVVYAFL